MTPAGDDKDSVHELLEKGARRLAESRRLLKELEEQLATPDDASEAQSEEEVDDSD